MNISRSPEKPSKLVKDRSQQSFAQFQPTFCSHLDTVYFGFLCQIKRGKKKSLFMFYVKQIKSLQFSLNTDKGGSHCSKCGINHTVISTWTALWYIFRLQCWRWRWWAPREQMASLELHTERLCQVAPLASSSGPSLDPCADTRGQNLCPWFPPLLIGQRQWWYRDPRCEGGNHCRIWKICPSF